MSGRTQGRGGPGGTGSIPSKPDQRRRWKQGGGGGIPHPNELRKPALNERTRLSGQLGQAKLALMPTALDHLLTAFDQRGLAGASH